MARPTDNTLFHRAVRLGTMDRLALADCYSQDSPHWQEARNEADDIHELEGRDIDCLTEPEQEIAIKAFLYAELWVEGLANSNPAEAVEAENRRHLRLFREVRHSRWGKTEIELMRESRGSVSVQALYEKSQSPSVSA